MAQSGNAQENKAFISVRFSPLARALNTDPSTVAARRTGSHREKDKGLIQPDLSIVLGLLFTIYNKIYDSRALDNAVSSLTTAAGYAKLSMDDLPWMYRRPKNLVTEKDLTLLRTSRKG